MYSTRSKRQQQIINESIKLIHTKGIQGLTTKNLAKAIDVTEAAIYRHFKSKDDILATILDDFRKSFYTYSQTVLSSENTAKEKLRQVLSQLTLVFYENPYIVSVIFSDEIFKNKEQLYNKIIQIITQNNKCFVSIVEEGQAKNEIRNDVTSAEIAVIIMGSFRMIVKNWQLKKQIYSLKVRSDEFIESLFKLLFH